MLDCLIIGDSIAVGVGSHIPTCKTIGKVGINSKNFVSAYLHHIPDARKTVISLGSNDGSISYKKSLVTLRSSIDHRVIWLLSANNKRAATLVKQIAAKHGDAVVDISEVELSRDRVHPTPTGYKTLAAAVAQW